MDSSSGLSGRSANKSVKNQWANVIGGAIALITLTLPPVIITHYSANNALDSLIQVSTEKANINPD